MLYRILFVFNKSTPLCEISMQGFIIGVCLLLLISHDDKMIKLVSKDTRTQIYSIYDNNPCYRGLNNRLISQNLFVRSMVYLLARIHLSIQLLY